MLTTLQILTLSQLSGVGTKKILKIGNSVQKINSIADLVDALKKNKIKMRSNEDSVNIDITELDLRQAEEKAKKIIEDNEKGEFGIISYYDKNFPQKLRETKDETGKEAPPIILYYKGNLDVLKMPALAIIGTRDVTPLGERAGIYLSKKFAQNGFCIVSGLALGCDTCAHRGALEVKGKTVAFLAHGLDTVYPVQNKKLADEIIQKEGLLLSEYPQGTTGSRYTFVARDRLQAGLANATLVIQTGEKGGTMHAANATLNANKPLYVVQYSDSHTASHEKTRGNELLSQKGAKKISCKADWDKIKSEILSCSSKNTVPEQNSLFG